ncbi:MAG: hypothetical protein M3Z24_08940 [Chloroflexota bacterium]|nr:hypothetical protein [Chloroflexota bacterium]
MVVSSFRGCGIHDAAWSSAAMTTPDPWLLQHIVESEDRASHWTRVMNAATTDIIT